MAIRVGFVTAVQLGLDCLLEIHRLGGPIDLIVTLDDETATKKSGRISLDGYAEISGALLHKTSHINNPATIEVIREASLDYLLVIGWSQLISRDVFPLVKHPPLGMHPTLLPEGRGRAPIPWTILKGLRHSGVTMFELSAEADTGNIIAVEEYDVSPQETATTLYDKAREAHVALIRKSWPSLLSGNLKGYPQDNTKATHWPQRRPADGEITADLSLAMIDKLVRATTRPYPGAFVIEGGQKLIIWAGSVQKLSEAQFTTPTLVRGNKCFAPTDFEWCY
jgi:methionyl-tRNA formyltransferase